jgi:hypothetical protein
MPNLKCNLRGCSNRALRLAVTIINSDGEKFEVPTICRTDMEEFIKEGKFGTKFTIERPLNPWARYKETK